MTGNKYCCLCNADMEEDENKERQEWFFPTDGIKRWYCSKCSEKAKSIEEEYIKRANNLREKHEYYNPLDLIMMVENLHIHRNTNIGIHFDNVFKYDKSIINAPILQDGKPIGVITNVTPEKVEGFIWERYMKLFAEFNSEQEPVAFELVYSEGIINECGQHIARDWSEQRKDMSKRKIYPYPLTIIQDRYSGMSAGGIFTAWNREVECIPDEVSGDDFEAIGFWEDYWANYDNITRDFDVIGVGNTPNDAVDDLIRRLQEKDLFIG